MNKLISLKNDEHINIVNKINYFNAPEKIYIPTNCLNNDIKINDYIYKNTHFKNCISSVSGFVIGIDEVKINKQNIDALVIKNDFKENINKKFKKKKINNIEELNELLNEHFLTDTFLKIKELDNIENLVISGIDEECYSAKEFITLQNNYREILDVIDLLISILKINKSILVTKNTNFKSIKNVKSIIGTYPNIKIILTPDKYLIGHKEFLCKFLNLKKDTTLILSVNEIYNIYNLINGKSILNTIITISGNAINKSLIINTKLGVSLNDILKEYISIKEKDYDIFINGFMQGYRINKEDNIIITKDIDYIVINKRTFENVRECINCGACNKICPVNINVKMCYTKKLKSRKCIGCGLCNYICPANIKLKEIVESDIYEKNS